MSVLAMWFVLSNIERPAHCVFVIQCLLSSCVPQIPLLFYKNGRSLPNNCQRHLEAGPIPTDFTACRMGTVTQRWGLDAERQWFSDLDLSRGLNLGDVDAMPPVNSRPDLVSYENNAIVVTVGCDTYG
ncbi:hypothetical protein J6590_067381 [Homalodisca vitripennis]|nr:hypothetical protein J6590_067381 [Homalodisca vitripennis]